MILDDDKDCLESLAALIHPLGMHYKLFSNPLEAVYALGRGHYDVMLTDLRMPRINGIDILHLCNELSLNTRIIILTGAADKNSAEIARKEGVYAYFRKPVNVNQLMNVLREISGELSSQSSSGPATASA